ncbi:ribose ABC transporter permease, partial [Burkholderia pseudomallei]
LLLRRSTRGRRCLALGPHPAAARLAVIYVRGILLFDHPSSRLLAGLGALRTAARLYAPTGLQLGHSYELDAHAAVI